LISESTASCNITIHNPLSTLIIDEAIMVREASGVYSYEYQTSSDDIDIGKWLVTFKATVYNFTALTQDRFILDIPD
jgi:hypothetical protein